MKFPNYDPKSDLLTNEQDNNSRDSLLGNDKQVSEEDKFNRLIKMSRYTSHQLNNLLTTILANVQLVMLMGGSEDPKPLLKAIEDSALNAGTMVTEFQKAIRALLKE